MSSRELYIRPDAAHAEAAIVTLLNLLEDGDQFELHTEASPPWMRVVANRAAEIVDAMEQSGVSVQLGDD